jgi:hypothetical protein
MIGRDVAMSQSLNQEIACVAEQARRARELNENIHSESLTRVAKERAANELFPLVELIAASAERLERMVQAEGETDPKPCWYCGQSQNPTQSDLEKHIEAAAQGAGGAGWPTDVFVARMRVALSIGDRLIWIGVGFVQVRRRDGRIESIYRQDA